MSGIRNRRWISGEETLRTMASAAGERAIVNSGVDRSRIGAVIPARSSRPKLANTSVASIPLAIEEMLVTGKAKGGQSALLLGFGAGLSYAGRVGRLPPAPRVPSF